MVFTLLGATGQSFRNATQKGLTGKLGTVGATHIRFLFGLPFGLVALGIVALTFGHVPTPNLASLAWTGVGALSQIAATALMLAAMRERSFVVTTAYTKTEPVQVAVFSVVFLGEHLHQPRDRGDHRDRRRARHVLAFARRPGGLLLAAGFPRHSVGRAFLRSPPSASRAASTRSGRPTSCPPPR